MSGCHLQVEQQQAQVNESAGALQSSTARAEAAEQAVRQEQARMAALYGANLDALSSAELSALVSVHEDGLRRIRALQVCNRRSQARCRDPGACG